MAMTATDARVASNPGTDETPRGHARSPLVPQLLFAALSGLLYVVAFPGINQFYLAFIAFVPVCWAARNVTPGRALLLGIVMGMVSHLIAYFWINHLLIVFAGAPWPGAAVGWILTAFGQGASYGVGLMLARWLQRRTGWSWAASLAVGLTAMDFVYPLVFPSYIANTMYGATWMMQTADLFGVLGLTALLGAINGAFVDLLMGRRRVAIVVGGLWAGALVYGAVRTKQIDGVAAAAPHMKVGTVQSNIGGMEEMGNFEHTLSIYRELTQSLVRRGADLVVWPEGAYNEVIDSDTNVAQTVLGGLHEPLLFGAVRVGVDGASHRRIGFNSAFLSNANGRVLGSYDKIVLLVFGEYLPFGDWFPQIYRWIPNASHWGRGQTTEPLVMGDWRIGTFICYEDILPRLVNQIMAARNGVRPNVMINVTNDSWYGPYSEQEEHLALASFRAVEHRRALVRATNTGISAIVDPAGRVVQRTDKFVETTMLGDIPRMEGTTIYEMIGDVAGYAAIAVLIAGWFIGRRRE